MSYGKLIKVERNLLLILHRPAFAAIHRVLFSFFSPCVVPVLSVFVRRAQVSLFDAAKDFLIKRSLEFFRRFHGGFGIDVFGIQVGDNFRVRLFSQPIIIVYSNVAMDGMNFRNYFCGRRHGGVEGCKLLVVRCWLLVKVISCKF